MVDKWEILFAALLHDVGKFYQRIKEPKTSHQECSIKLLDELGLSEILRRILGDKRLDRVKYLIEEHHRKSAETKLIVLADHASAGERIRASDEISAFNLKPAESPLVSPYWAWFVRKQEQPPSSILEVAEQIKNKKMFFAPVPLRIPPDITDPVNYLEQFYPKTLDDALQMVGQSYNQVYNFLRELVNKLHNLVNTNIVRSPWSLYRTLIEILRCTFFFIPSAVFKTALPDISLYVHQLLTAAIADALLKTGGERYRIVYTDVSGIQSFIRTIARTAGASRLLRGRSLLIELLGRAIVSFLLKKLGLEISSAIAVAGGNAIIIVPDSQETIKKVEEAYSIINETCVKEFNGDLYATIAISENSVDVEKTVDFFSFVVQQNISLRETFAGCLHEAILLCDERKFRKYIVIKDIHHKHNELGLFPSSEAVTAENILCDCCKVSLPYKATLEDKERILKVADEEINICRACYLSYLLGKIARNAVFLVEIIFPEINESELLKVAELIESYSSYQKFSYGGILFRKMGVAYLLFEWLGAERSPIDEWRVLIACLGLLIESMSEKSEDAVKGMKITIYRLNDTINFIPDADVLDFLREVISNREIEIAFAYDFLNMFAPSVKEDKTYRVMEFDEMVLKDYEEQTLLAWCAMDTDDMGEIAATISASPSRFVTASELLKFFYNVVSNMLLQADNLKVKGQPPILLIFSGGDDMCFVGRFDKVIEYILLLHNSFEKIFGDVAVTMSAGIIIVPPKYPVHLAYGDVRSAEHQSKLALGKNHISPFGTEMNALKWDDFVKIKELAQKLYDLMDKNQVSKSLVYKMHTIATRTYSYSNRLTDTDEIPEEILPLLISYIYLYNRFSEEFERMIRAGLPLLKQQEIIERGTKEFADRMKFLAYVTNLALILAREGIPLES